MQLRGQNAQRSPRVNRGQTSIFRFRIPWGVLTTKFYSYPMNTSQVIPFLRSIIAFSGKRLLTPEGVAGGFSLTRRLFSGFVSYVDCCNKIIMPPFSILMYIAYFRSKGVFSQVLIASNPTAGFGSNYNTRCILPLPIIPPSDHWRPRNDFRKLGVGLFT